MRAVRKTAYIGVLVTLALAFSYVEAMIPINFGIPGVKLGLANLVILVALYYLDTATAFGINMIRIVLASILFGTAMTAMYSIAGGLLSFLAMWGLKRCGLFSLTGVSLGGGIAHNIGQILVAMLVLENLRIAVYLPVLLISGLITGVLIGLCAGQILRHLPKQKPNLP